VPPELRGSLISENQEIVNQEEGHTDNKQSAKPAAKKAKSKKGKNE
jgi:hypothetical protein